MLRRIFPSGDSSVEFENTEPLTSSSAKLGHSPLDDLQLYGYIVMVNNTSCCSDCCIATLRQQRRPVASL